ncbi:MAG TPA: nucleoside triphosphate pyrophosphohydrolase [Bacillota bacterium]|nr:nucleoside triphosphate pyrophosphohydrolase [Bacillota bacterium]HOK68104.1 nucleoside triphosphate pyrophosphohydrolase [Bacillota bacterium]HPP84406.1 nucleoside triphosphate pyrophosphohydrolase [Bacillota bacterium]
MSKEITEIQELKSKERYGFDDLCRIMALLRSENGCSWDREQTHKSIRKNLIEETYEVIEAIDREDFVLMREELGDLLLQVVFHAQMAKEEAQFDIGGVIDELCKKLIIRHPHVFGDVSVSGSAEVLKNWDAIKYKTKKVKTSAEAMNSISPALPALMRAHKIGEKGAKIGFDFDDSADALTKVKEEVAEVEEAIKTGSKERIGEEIGDLLLAVVNVARLSKVDAEEALYRANEKFIERFAEVEKNAVEQGIDIASADRETKEALWKRSKH